MTNSSLEAGLNPETRVILARLRTGVAGSGQLFRDGFERVGSSIHQLREAGFLIRTKETSLGTLYFLAAEPVGLRAGSPPSQESPSGAESDGKVACRPVQDQPRSRRAGRKVPVGFADSLFDTRSFEVDAA